MYCVVNKVLALLFLFVYFALRTHLSGFIFGKFKFPSFSRLHLCTHRNVRILLAFVAFYFRFGLLKFMFKKKPMLKYRIAHRTRTNQLWVKSSTKIERLGNCVLAHAPHKFNCPKRKINKTHDRSHNHSDSIAIATPFGS